MGNGLGDTSEQKLFQAFSPVRAQHDAVGPPFGGDVKDAHTRLAFHDTRLDVLESGRMERFGGVKHQLFRPAAPLLQAGVLFKKSGAFDYMNQQDFIALRAQLRCQHLRCCVGELRTING